MLEIPQNITYAKSSAELMRQLSLFVPSIIQSTKVIIKAREKIFNQIVKPLEWKSNEEEHSISNKELIGILNKEISNSKEYAHVVIGPENYLHLFSPVVDEISPLDILICSDQTLSSEELSDVKATFFEITKIFLQLLKIDCEIHGISFESVYPTLSYNLMKREIIELKNSLTKKEMVAQSLFEFSQSLSTSESLSFQVSSSLKSLCQVTSCDSAACYVSDEKDATLTFAGGYRFKDDKLYANHTSELVAWACDHDETIILPFSKKQTNSIDKPQKESTAIIVPLRISNKNLGAVLLMCSNVESVSQINLTFIQSACSLLALAINQHRVIAKSTQLALISEKAAKLNSALYRFTHEITTLQNLEEVFHSAFQIMHEELQIQRFWLGLLNEPGTRIIGQAAFGSGWKRKLVEMNIDISGQDHPLAQVIRTRELMVVREVDEILKGLGLKKFIEKHHIEEMILVPLISSGQIIGVLAYESHGENEIQNTIHMFAAELANVIFSKRLEERLSASETMRAAGLLAAGIAHNFNNLLQGIMGQASIIELYADNPEQIKKSSKIISDSTAKGASLVKQLMSFAYLEDPSIEKFNVNNLIDLNKINFQRLLKSEQFIRYHLDQSIEQASADPRQVVRIINTLLSNASEAMDANGVVEIISDKVVVNESSPHFDVPYGAYVTIGVRDNGVGMDADTKKRCFEPFFSTKNVDKASGLGLQGSGMGLAAAYALAKKNGGRLIVDSRKGHGSLFTLYIPSDVHTFDEVSDNTLGVKKSVLAGQVEVVPLDESNSKTTTPVMQARQGEKNVKD